MSDNLSTPFPTMIDLADFCEHFQRLQAPKRLELLVSLLEMLNALELRFVGAYLEELARKDYYCLRESEIRSNSGQMVAQFSDLSDSTCRGRLVVALSLLYSGNYAASSVLHKILLNLNPIFHQLPKTKEVIDELILLLVMAKYHPAFRFCQKTDIVEMLDRLIVMAEEIDDGSAAPAVEENQDNVVDMETASAIPMKSMVDAATQANDDQDRSLCTCQGREVAPSGDLGSPRNQQKCLFVTNIAVKGTRKTENEDVYDLQIVWSNDEQTEVSKTLREMYDFHKQLLDWYPRDAGACGSGRKIPYFPGYRDGSAGESISSQLVTREVYDYIKDLVKLSPEILRSEYTVNFFRVTSPVASPSSTNQFATLSSPAPKRPTVLDPGSSEEADCLDADGRVKSLTIYNSHVAPGGLKSKDASKQETRTSPTLRQESETQSTSSPGTSSRVSKKSHGSTSSRLQSPSQKTFESTTTTSPMSTDLVSTTSSTSGKKSARKSSTSSLPSQQFIPMPLYGILKDEGGLEVYKHHLCGRTLDELCAMTESDLVNLGVPLKPCLAVITSVKNCCLYARTKQVNGTIVPKVNAADVVGEMLPFMSRSTPPILDFRSNSVGPDGVPIVAPVPVSGMPYVNVGALSVDTGLHAATGGTINYGNTVTEPTTIVSCSSDTTTQFSESNPTTDVSSTSTILDSRFQPSTQPKSLHPSNSELATSALSSDPSQISAAWMPHSSEEEFPSVVRSYSVDSSDHTATGGPYMVAFNATSSSLPPSQSQSPAHNEGQQPLLFYPPTTAGTLPTATAFPVQHNANANNNQHQHHYQHHQRNPKHTYRAPVPTQGYKGNVAHPSNSLQRRNYSTATYDYSRPQQPPLVSFMSPHHQSIGGHQMALSAIPAANFVRAPQAAASGTIPPQPRLRFVCQQCNGTSSSCSVCQGSWNNGLLTPANAAAAGAPLLFHLPTTPSGPPPQTPQLFSPYLTTPPGNNPLAAQFFGASPANYRLSAAGMAASPMVFKSASATLIPGEQQHFVSAMDQQQMMRSLGNEAFIAIPYLAAHPMESCCNCGMQGHTREDCTEPALDDTIASSRYHLNFADSASTSQDR